jgi:anaerobic selenocysteine-containing dehydrogenase
MDGGGLGGMVEVHGACPHDCYDTCGLTVMAEGGRITAIRPDSRQPLTGGFLCLKVNRYLERLYHPDRVLYPLRRVGQKGEGRFERVSWDAALADIAERLEAISRRDGAEAIMPYSFAGNMGILAYGSMDARFFHALGATRLERTICTAASGAALDWVYGQRLGPDPETIPRARFILLWGSNPVATNVHEIPLLENARRAGAEVWTIDPLKTETARCFDRHLALRPGTDLALALGLGRALVERGAVDQAFLDARTEGVEAYVREAEPWTLDRTAAETGLARRDLEDLLEQIQIMRPLLFRTGYGVQRQRASARTVWAISALSLLTGSLQDVGGGHLLSNGDAFPLNYERLTRPDLAPGPTRRVNMVQLGLALTTLNAPPVKALVVYNANPAATAPDQARVLAGLSSEDLFTVVHEQMLTDTCRYADYVLPAAMAMEVWDLHTSYWHRYIQLNRPAADPPGEAVSNPEFFRRLARAMGLQHPALQASDWDLMRDALDTDHPWLAGITLETLLRDPVQRVRLDPMTRPFVDTRVTTPTGKLRLTPPPFDVDVDEREDNRFPFHFISPSVRETIKSTFGNVESLKARRPVPELLVHPEDLRRLGITSGQTVRVYNHRGATWLRAVASDVPPPGTVVSYAVRWNHEAHGTNINQLTGEELADGGGGATFYSTRVAIVPELADVD